MINLKNNSAVALLATILFSCVSISSNAAKEVRKVTRFREIKASSAINLVLTQSSKQIVEVEASSDFIDEVITEVIGDELVIRIDPTSMRMIGSKSTVYVSTNNLEELKVSGASKVTSTNEIKVGKLDIEVSGASSINLSLNVGELEVTASGASKIELAGSARKSSFEVSGATKISAFRLNSKHVEVEVSGASKTEVFATNTISIEATGASAIRHKGGAKIIEQKIMGASSVKPVR